MSIKYIINYKVLFSPDEHRLTPLGIRGDEVILHAPVSRILLLLLQNSGNVVRQEDIFREVWEKHGQVVAANTLYQNVSLLRKGLLSAGIIAESVRTLPKVGFIFKGKVQLHEEEAENSIYFPVDNQSPLSPGDTLVSETLPTKGIITPKEVLKSDEVKRTARLTRVLIKIWKGKRLIHLFYLAVVLILATALLIFRPDNNRHFITTHTKIATVNQCGIYVDIGNLQANSQKYINALKEKKVTCSPAEFIYITRKIASTDVQVLLCGTNSDGDVQCSTKFRVPKEN